MSNLVLETIKFLEPKPCMNNQVTDSDSDETMFVFLVNFINILPRNYDCVHLLCFFFRFICDLISCIIGQGTMKREEFFSQKIT